MHIACIVAGQLLMVQLTALPRCTCCVMVYVVLVLLPGSCPALSKVLRSPNPAPHLQSNTC